MQTPSLFQRATAEPQGAEPEAGFKKHNIDQFIPPELKDIVDRVVAAGMKVMYSDDMKEDILDEIKRDVPPAQKMAEATVGMVLMLDQRSKGIPMAALFPVAMKLLDESAEILVAAGQPVTQEDYSDAARRVFVLMGQKLGATPDQIMEGAGSGVPPEEPGEPQGQMPMAPQQMPMPQGAMQ